MNRSNNPCDYPQWVCWNPANGKAPIQINGWPASVRNPSHWATYDNAVEAANRNGWGIGFVLTKDDPFVVIDLDKSNLPENYAKHQEILKRFSETYQERSPSGNGFHIWCIGTLPKNGIRRDSIEMYFAERYFTITGNGNGKAII